MRLFHASCMILRMGALMAECRTAFFVASAGCAATPLAIGFFALYQAADRLSFVINVIWRHEAARGYHFCVMIAPTAEP